jgi:hypothetical protein
MFQDIKVRTVLGGTVEDTELIDGLLLTQKVCCGPRKVEKAKIGLIQFCISPPKTDVSATWLITTTSTEKLLKQDLICAVFSIDGYECCGLRLYSNGSNFEGGAESDFGDCKENQGGWLQCPSHSKIYSTVRDLRSEITLPV